MAEKYFSVYTGAQIDDKATGVFGGLHAHANATAQSIPNGTSYTKIVNFMDADSSQNVTSSVANNDLTVLKGGTFRVEGAFSMFSGTAAIDLFVSVFVNGIEAESLHFSRRISTSGDIGSAALSGLLDLSANDVIDVRARHSSGSAVNITFSYMNFNLSRIEI